MYTRGRCMLMYGKTNTILYSKKIIIIIKHKKKLFIATKKKKGKGFAKMFTLEKKNMISSMGQFPEIQICDSFKQPINLPEAI